MSEIIDDGDSASPQQLKVNEYTFYVTRKGNFSILHARLYLDPSYRLAILRLIRKVFFLFEERFDLKIISWETSHSASEITILVNHEPKEKAGIAHPFEHETDPDDPDIKL